MGVENFLKNIFMKKEAFIVSRGNDAIGLALESIRTLTEKRVLLVPDQGGWISYPKLAKKHGFEFREVKTDRGVIVIDELVKSLEGVGCFLFTGLAGYYAEQPIDEILKICKENEVFVVNDISGCFGSDLCKGDFLVGSCGKGKVVNYGKHGFIVTDFLEKSLQKDKGVKYDSELFDYLKRAPERFKRLLSLAGKVKEDLKDFDVFHKEKRGVNVIASFDERIIDYCKENNYEYVICPKSFKVNEKAISIELKRLEL